MNRQIRIDVDKEGAEWMKDLQMQSDMERERDYGREEEFGMERRSFEI